MTARNKQKSIPDERRQLAETKQQGSKKIEIAEASYENDRDVSQRNYSPCSKRRRIRPDRSGRSEQRGDDG